MRRLLLRFHLYAALIAGLFVVVLGVTGSIMAFEPELDHLFHPALFYVTPAARTLSLAELAASASKVFPGERASSYVLATDPDLSWSLNFKSGAVFVNPYTGAVLGVRQGPTVLARIHQLHLRLLIRNASDTGKTIMSWAGVGMLALALSGLYLWWPQKRMTVKWRAAAPRVWFDVHNVSGIVSMLFLLLLSATGVAIGFDEQIVPLFYRATASAPLATSVEVTPVPGATPLAPDRALAIAREALPGASPLIVGMPGPRTSYRIAARFPEDRTPGGRSRIYIDQYTGRVLLVESSRTTAPGTRLVILNRAIHTGDLFGLPSKAVMSFASLMVVVQGISGAAIWWTRRPTRRR